MKDIRIAAAVTHCPFGKKYENLDGMIKWIRAAKKQSADIICFPELNISGYSTRREAEKLAEPVPGAISGKLGEIATSENICILAGFAEKDAENIIYASHLVVKSDGSIDIYRKAHIAPPEKRLFHPAPSIPLFEINGVKFGIQLCYDAHFPELTTHMALRGADIIFIPHASPRGTPEEKYTSWLRHLPARAFDNSVFIVACNQTGDNKMGLNFPGLAMVIDPSGRILRKDISGSETILTANLSSAMLDRIRTHKMRYFLPNRRPDLYGKTGC